MKILTRKQNDIYKYMVKFLEKNHRPPTVRELADEFKITPSAMHQNMRLIAKKGYIDLTVHGTYFRKYKVKLVKI